MMIELPLVTKDDDGIRPAGKPDECFYCGAKVGEHHHYDCVTVTKTVKVKATVEYEIEVPLFWKKDNIEFHYNDGTWCADNIVNDLDNYIAKLNEKGECLCPYCKIEVLDDVAKD